MNITVLVVLKMTWFQNFYRSPFLNLAVLVVLKMTWFQNCKD